MIPTNEQLEEWLAMREENPLYTFISFRYFQDVIRELQAERKRNLTLRKRIHCAESHNQYFERCESRWCNPAPPLACGGYEIHDPADEAHGDKFYVAVRAEADRLTTAGLIERDDLKALTVSQQGELDRLNLKLWQSGTRARELAKALEFYEKLDEYHANCDECFGDAPPEECEMCFPLADNALLGMRAALARYRAARDESKLRDSR